jgi:uroporphyrin-3 C-methyltransferase
MSSHTPDPPTDHDAPPAAAATPAAGTDTAATAPAAEPASPAPATVAATPASAAAAAAPPAAAVTGTASVPPARGNGPLWLLVLGLIALSAGLWWSGERRLRAADAEAASVAQRLEALESRNDGLRRDVRSHGQRLQQADSTNRVLRDELLGLNQRSALLEEQLAKLAEANRQGAEALRLDEAELLLGLGQQRLLLASDLDGARRAYALAAGVLERLDSPGLLNLRQTLAQESADLAALPADPRQQTVAALDAFARSLPPVTAPAAAAARTDAPWWERALGKLVRISPSDASVAVSGADRAAALHALQLELTLARAAAERRDAAGLRAALLRADGWLLRLWPDSAQRRALRARLQTLAAQPLRVEMPTLGSTLEQLRAQRRGGRP